MTFATFLVIFSTLPPLISRYHFPVWDFKLHRLVNWQYLGEICVLKSETLCPQLLPDSKGMDNINFFLIYPTWSWFLLSAFKVNFCPRRDCRHWQNKETLVLTNGNSPATKIPSCVLPLPVTGWVRTFCRY